MEVAMVRNVALLANDTLVPNVLPQEREYPESSVQPVCANHAR